MVTHINKNNTSGSTVVQVSAKIWNESSKLKHVDLTLLLIK